MQDKIYVTKASMPTYEEYIEAIKPLWDSHWITNMGQYHHELEDKLKEFLKVPYVSLMVNGHMALEMAIQSFNFPNGKEVITTPFTFISTTHAIVRNNLVPVFCDVKESDGTIDETKIEELITENTVAIVPVHVYGNICNVDEIERIAYKYNLKVIYDSAHAFAETYKGIQVGNFGDASCFSFHATKVFNTIEGGAVCFNDSRMYERLYNLKNFGIRGEELVVDIGANAKLNEFAAIMGLCNLIHVTDNIEARKARYEYYLSKLKLIDGIDLFKSDSRVDKNYAYLPILVKDHNIKKRDEIYNNLRENGIYARKYFYPLTSDQACFKNRFKNDSLEVARDLASRVLCLPLYPELDYEDIDRILSLL